jgi:hypothetical protein
MALTLASGISASDRYCTVNQPPTQPPGSYYRIGDEVVQHIGYVTTTPIWTPNFTQLYIARAQLGTAAASHLSAAALTYVRPEFLSATAETDPGPFETGGGGGGGGSDVLTDPGNVFEPSTAVTAGYRIAETIQGASRVFEVSVGGTTDEFVPFSDYMGRDGLTPLAETITGTVTWRYLGVVGELPWDIVPLPGIGLDDQGLHVDAFWSIGEGNTMFRLLAALPEPDNVWEPTTLIDTGAYRIGVMVGGALRVFEVAALGTTGASEPAWATNLIGDITSDGTVNWSYLGLVGGPDTEHPVFVANSAGDADWFLDVNNGSGFRFNLAADGISVPDSRRAEFTTDGFNVVVASAGFHVMYDPFAIIMAGLPTADPANLGQVFTDGAPSTGVPKPLLVSGG